MTFDRKSIHISDEDTTLLFNLLEKYATARLETKGVADCEAQELCNEFRTFIAEKKDDKCAELLAQIYKNTKLCLFLLQQLEKFISTPECLVSIETCRKCAK